MTATMKKNGMRLAAAMSGLLVMMTAAPAFAGHEEALRNSHRQTNHACGINGCTERHHRQGFMCFAKREFDRGYDLGYREGNDRGYRDARWCNPYCDGIPRRLKRFSKFFAAGYRDAYAVAYHDGFYHREAPRRPNANRRGNRNRGDAHRGNGNRGVGSQGRAPRRGWTFSGGWGSGWGR